MLHNTFGKCGHCHIHACIIKQGQRRLNCCAGKASSSSAMKNPLLDEGLSKPSPPLVILQCNDPPGAGTRTDFITPSCSWLPFPSMFNLKLPGVYPSSPQVDQLWTSWESSARAQREGLPLLRGLNNGTAKSKSAASGD